MRSSILMGSMFIANSVNQDFGLSMSSVIYCAIFFIVVFCMDFIDFTKKR